MHSKWSLPSPLAVKTPHPKATIEAITAKWKEHTDYFKSFDFICNGEHFQVASMLDRRESPDDKVPDDISHRRRRFVLAEDGRNRSEGDGREWDGSKKSYVPKQTVEVFDGKGRNLLFISDRFDQPHADFHIRSGDLFGKDLRGSPLRMALRPFRAGVGEFSTPNLVLTDEKDTIDQHPVLVLKTDNKKLWVDPEKDFLPVKREDEIRGVVQRKIELTYVRDETHGWIPNSWTITLFDQTGATWWQDTMMVTEFSITKPIDNSEFELSLPIGTVVKDYATGDGWNVKAKAEKEQASPKPTPDAKDRK